MSTVSTPDPVSAPTRLRRPYLDLFLVSFLILFFELACIRWFGSTVIFLTFFTNIVLHGLLPGDVGRLPGGVAARRLHQRWCIPLTRSSLVGWRASTLWRYCALRPGDRSTSAARGRRSRSSSGPSTRPPTRRGSSCRSRSVAGVFFVLIALMFVGPGAGDGPGVRRDPRPGLGLHDQRRWAAWPGSSAFGAGVVLPHAARRLVRDRRLASCSAFIRAALALVQMSAARSAS